MTGNQKQLVGFPYLSCQEHFLFITVHLKKGEEGTLVKFKKAESHIDSCQASCPSVTLMCLLDDCRLFTQGTPAWYIEISIFSY